MHTTSHSQASSLVVVNGRMDSNQTTKQDWSGTLTGLRPIKALVSRYTDEARDGDTACVQLHTTVFQVEMYANKACIMENVEKWG
jgi:hypothetical protein